jgi:hypothetical protein
MSREEYEAWVKDVMASAGPHATEVAFRFPRISQRTLAMLDHSRSWVKILLISGLLVLATESPVGAQQKKPTKPPPRPPSISDPDETKNKAAIESEQLKPARYRGQLVSKPNEGGLFRVAVEYQRVRVKRGKEAEYDRLQKDSVEQAARSTAKQTQAQTRAGLTPSNRAGKVALPDRREISAAAGIAVGAATKFEGEYVLLKRLLETVSDTQTVIFHAAPNVQVRVLKPSDKPVDSIPSTAQREAKEVKNKQDKTPLTGYEGELTDLKVGQRVMLQLAPANNEGKQLGVAPGSIHKRLVTLVVVEEEAQQAQP